MISHDNSRLYSAYLPDGCWLSDRTWTLILFSLTVSGD
ncbi:hypothetical protein TFLX_00606 [Thermoflexales bacterium]|nr:hypothetical protein TFLX_00606 [Thermoflexales bacterium]